MQRKEATQQSYIQLGTVTGQQGEFIEMGALVEDAETNASIIIFQVQDTRQTWG